MAIALLSLLLCLAGHAFAEEPPDVDCLVVHLQDVRCWWNTQGTPEVNYTFYSSFNQNRMGVCPTYVTANGTRTGCVQPLGEKSARFMPFFTRLQHGNSSREKQFDLRSKVKLNPPTNLTVVMGADSNLWYYWNQTSSRCVESQVRSKVNQRPWDTSDVSTGRQFYTINMPSSNSLYRLQVRSRIASLCGQSTVWSEWSEPVAWGSNNGTDTNHQMNGLMSVWTPILFIIGVLVFILLAVSLLHHERVRIILLPVVPKPSLVAHDIQDWIQISKGLKESYNQSYNERACPVQEYHPVSQSDRSSLHSSVSSLSSEPVDCSVLLPADESCLSSPCSSTSSTSTVLVSSEEAEQVSV